MPGKAPNEDIYVRAGAILLDGDYYFATPTYEEKEFRRRLRMSRRLFDNIFFAVDANGAFLKLRCDPTGRCGGNSDAFIFFISVA